MSNEGSSDGMDRREGSRHLSCFPAHIRREAEGSQRTAIIRDVSVSGAQLVTRARMEAGEAVQLSLYISSDTTQPRVVRARVVRAVARELDSSDWPFSVAVRFDAPLHDCEADLKALADKQAELFGLPDRGAKP